MAEATKATKQEDVSAAEEPTAVSNGEHAAQEAEPKASEPDETPGVTTEPKATEPKVSEPLNSESEVRIVFVCSFYTFFLVETVIIVYWVCLCIPLESGHCSSASKSMILTLVLHTWF